MKPASPVYTGRPDDGTLGAPRTLSARLADGVGGLPYVRGTDEYGAFYESRWTLDEHDLATLVRGGSLILRVWGASHPMVSIAAWPSADAPAAPDAGEAVRA